MPTGHQKIDTPQKAFALAEERYVKRHAETGMPYEALREKFRKTATGDTMVLQLYNEAFRRTNDTPTDISKAEIAAFMLP